MSTEAQAGSAAGGLPDRYREIRRVTVVGGAVDFALGVAKILGGWLGHSQALIADGVHSMSDLATDVFVIYAAKHAHYEADEEHPYGHARIETAATVALGVVLVAIGAGIAWDAANRLFHPERLRIPAVWALWIAGASVVAKEVVYHYTMRYARRLRSKMLRANAWHSRTDALSSVVVILGVGGAQLGLWYLDSVAAFVVAVMIAKIGFDLAKSSMSELIDTGLAPEQLEDIRSTIYSVGGVSDLHMLRTRQMGGRALVDVHILLEDPKVSVSEGHHISETVRERLIARIEDVEDVMVHIDPEDDEDEAEQARRLGLRREILARLHARWADLEAAPRIRRVTLHYLDARIGVEVELPVDLAPQAQDLRSAFEEAVADEADISGVRVLFA